ncbi:MAG: hypothetical protein KAF40_08815 [Flavihumibacter sp.]|nr:hypothetical protein [Flavihumibacter sp.]
MILEKKRWQFIPIHEHWFDFTYHWSDLLCMAVYFRIPETDKKPIGMIEFTGRSVQVNLRQDKTEIWKGFSKQTKNYIRQAEKKALPVRFDQDLVGFVTYFNKFALFKKIPSLSIKDFSELHTNFLVSKVYLEAEIVAMHLYLLHAPSGQVQLFRSASGRYFLPHLDKNDIGAANKFMHFKAMDYFKEQGFTNYDFGGFSQPTDPDYKKFKGVNQFKKNFGGEEFIFRNIASPAYYAIKKLTDLLASVR